MNQFLAKLKRKERKLLNEHKHQAKLLIFAEKILRKCKCQPNLLHEDKRVSLERKQNRNVRRSGLN